MAWGKRRSTFDSETRRIFNLSWTICRSISNSFLESLYLSSR